MMDVERILQTKIPDIAPVYGGVRGRTISSHKQAYAWKTIVAAGLKQVIDLRKDDYFHYPIDNDHETIVKMAELFPVFCEKIDEGDFYIACAMGLHRTDIALCTYWMFYAADKGIMPPPIRGYRIEKGMNTSKIMRIVNALYKYWTEQSGIPPIPEETFRERKAKINELARL